MCIYWSILTHCLQCGEREEIDSRRVESNSRTKLWRPTQPTVLTPPCRVADPRGCEQEEVVPRWQIKGYCQYCAALRIRHSQMEGHQSHPRLRYRRDVVDRRGRVVRCTQTNRPLYTTREFFNETRRKYVFKTLSERKALADLVDRADFNDKAGTGGDSDAEFSVSSDV